MKKFLVLYNAPASAMEQMSKMTPEQSKAGMDAWMAWSKRAGKAIVDLGLPLGNGTRIAKGGGTSATTCEARGYSILQGESAQEVQKLMQGHPHFEMQGASIDVIEGLPIPG